MTSLSSPSQPGAHSWRESLLACSLVSVDLQNMSLKKYAEAYLFESLCFCY